MSDALRAGMYRAMRTIRLFEERVLELFSLGRLAGTTHVCIGQEVIPCALMPHLTPEDVVVSNHRCHGHYLAHTGDYEGLFAELFGRAGGVCGGRGGSQHLCKGHFYTNGILGSTAPLAAGLTYARARRAPGSLGVLFLGDGAMGQGVVYEAFNLAALWSIPLLVVLEDNLWAQSTPQSVNLAGSFQERARAFGLDCGQGEARDAEALHRRFGLAVEAVRRGGRPRVEVVRTYRLCAHSKGDDCRPAEEVAAGWARDPLALLAGRLSAEQVATLDREAREVVEQAERAALGQPLARVEEWTC